MLAGYTEHMSHKAKCERGRLKERLARMETGWKRCAAEHATSVPEARFPTLKGHFVVGPLRSSEIPLTDASTRRLVKRTREGCEELQRYVREFTLPPKFRQARGLFLIVRSARTPTILDRVRAVDAQAALEELQNLLGFDLDSAYQGERQSQGSMRPILRMRKTSVSNLIRAAMTSGQSSARVKRGADLSQSDEVFLDCLLDLAGADRQLRICAEEIRRCAAEAVAGAHARATQIGREYLRRRMRNAAKQEVEARFAEAMFDGQKELVCRFAEWLQARPPSTGPMAGPPITVRCIRADPSRPGRLCLTHSVAAQPNRPDAASATNGADEMSAEQ